MERYETQIDDGLLYLDGPDRRIEVGEFEAIVDELGEIYEIEYSEEQQAVPWLDLNEENVLEVDVRETLGEISFDEEFADLVADAPLQGSDDELAPRTSLFVDLVRDIWDPAGDVDEL